MEEPPSYVFIIYCVGIPITAYIAWKIFEKRLEHATSTKIAFDNFSIKNNDGSSISSSQKAIHFHEMRFWGAGQVGVLKLC
jgi:hypothetical protein